MIQLINDNKGNPTGVFVPISEWNALKEQFPLPEPWDESVPQWQKDILDERERTADPNSWIKLEDLRSHLTFKK